MSEEFKLNINIPQKKIEEMARGVIREIVESQITEAMERIDINKIITGKANTLDSRINKIAETAILTEVKNLGWDIRDHLKKEVRTVILSELQKKPLTGNVYLKIDNANVDTDFDY